MSTESQLITAKSYKKEKKKTHKKTALETRQCWHRKTWTVINAAGSVGTSALLSHFSCIWFFVTLCIIAYQAPLSMGFSRQEYSVCAWLKVKNSRHLATLFFFTRTALRRSCFTTPNVLNFNQNLTDLEERKCPTPGLSSYPLPP